MKHILIVRIFIVVYLLEVLGGGIYFFFIDEGPAPFLASSAVEILDAAKWEEFTGMVRYFFGYTLGTGLLLLWVFPSPKEREAVFYGFVAINVIATASRVLPMGLDAWDSGLDWVMFAVEAPLPAAVGWVLWQAPAQEA